MSDVLHRSKKILRGIFLFGIIFSICSSILQAHLVSSIPVAYAQAPNLTPLSCTTGADPTNRSLLVVLLDRSGSLVVQPGATDPDGFSTSVTKALADLWPGLMMVIPFGDPLLNHPNTTVPVLPVYKANLSDQTQRDKLKENVQNYPIQGGTPLAPAMRKALAQPEVQSAAPGSRVIIITDGQPTPTATYGESSDAQKKQIETELIGEFKQKCLPVSAFGLQTDAEADSLLGDIAQRTGGVYTKVQSPGELALQVITLYAQWRHYSFTKEAKDLTDNTYHVEISELARQANIVAFHSTGFTPGVTGPSGQPVQTIPNTDNHYEITSIGTSQIASGIYKVDMGGDPAAQVYALVDSKLQVGINNPSVTTTIYVGQSIKIDASLLNGNARFTPKKQAALNAFVTFTANGQQQIPDAIPLTQQLTGDKDAFVGYTPAYSQLGQVQIFVKASYDNTDRQSNTVTVQLAPPPCNKGFVQCFWEEHQPQTIGLGALLLLLLFLLFRISRPAPYGALEQGGHVESLGRPFLTRIFGSSSISSKKLDGIFDFRGGEFVLDFKGGAHIKAKRDEPKITVRSGNNSSQVVSRSGVPLADNDTISVGGYPVATFRDSDPNQESETYTHKDYY